MDQRLGLLLQKIGDPFTVLARCLGVLCTFMSLLWGDSLLTLVGHWGIIDPSLARSVTLTLPLALQGFFPPSLELDIALVILSGSLAVLGVCLYCRPRSSLFGLLLYLALVCFKQSVPLMAYGLFEFLQLGLFYVAVANIASVCFSFDWTKRQRADRLVGNFLRGHLALAYFSAGLCKAVGPQWWSGESLWRALARTDSSGQRWFNMYGAGHFPLLLQIVGIATVLAETLYPLAFFTRLRPFIVGGLLLMHIGTIVFQGLTLFGLTMISLNVFFLLHSSAGPASTPGPGEDIPGERRLLKRESALSESRPLPSAEV